MPFRRIIALLSGIVERHKAAGQVMWRATLLQTYLAWNVFLIWSKYFLPLLNYVLSACVDHLLAVADSNKGWGQVTHKYPLANILNWAALKELRAVSHFWLHARSVCAGQEVTEWDLLGMLKLLAGPTLFIFVGSLRKPVQPWSRFSLSLPSLCPWLLLKLNCMLNVSSWNK